MSKEEKVEGLISGLARAVAGEDDFDLIKSYIKETLKIYDLILENEDEIKATGGNMNFFKDPDMGHEMEEVYQTWKKRLMSEICVESIRHHGKDITSTEFSRLVEKDKYVDELYPMDGND